MQRIKTIFIIGAKLLVFCGLAWLGIYTFPYVLKYIPTRYINYAEISLTVAIVVVIGIIAWKLKHKKIADNTLSNDNISNPNSVLVAHINQSNTERHPSTSKVSEIIPKIAISTPDSNGNRFINLGDLSPLWVSKDPVFECDSVETKPTAHIAKCPPVNPSKRDSVETEQPKQQPDTQPNAQEDTQEVTQEVTQEEAQEEAQEIAGDTGEEMPEFTHPDILDYYHKYILTKKVGFLQFPPRLAVVKEILHLLDTDGDCPSVVNITALTPTPEKESDYVKQRTPATDKSSTYDILRMCTLREHSLNVAQEIEVTSTGDIRVPFFIIAALGHDLGKMPRFTGSGYVTGDHPINSKEILENNISSFSDLFDGDKENILTAVRNHHQSDNKDEWTMRLISADRECRERELYKYTAIKGEKVVSNEKLREYLGNKDLMDRKRERPSPKVNTNKRNYKKYDMSWLNLKDFFSILKEKVNKLDGKNYRVISMLEGNVYVWPNVVTEILIALAGTRHKLDIVACAGNDQSEKELLLSAMDIFRENTCIDKSKIRDGYIGSWFEVLHVYSSENQQPPREETRRFYGIPFRADAFGSKPSELEELKNDDFIKSVKKFTQNNSRKP